MFYFYFGNMKVLFIMSAHCTCSLVSFILGYCCILVSPIKRSKAERHDDRPKVDKLSLKKKGIGSEVRAERMANADADLQLLNEHERERQLQKQKKRRRQGKEQDVRHSIPIHSTPPHPTATPYILCLIFMCIKRAALLNKTNAKPWCCTFYTDVHII